MTTTLNATSSRTFIAGHRGLLGSALVRAATTNSTLILPTRDALDLRDAADVEHFMQAERPTRVILAAARVGGIHANSTYPVEFLADNLAIYTNVIESARRAGVERLIFVGSNCSYPRSAPQPIAEASLFQGEVEPTNSAFAMAKLAAIELCRACNQQYGTRYLAVMPTSLYGPGDNYDPANSHVAAAMIRRFVQAAKDRTPVETIWGSGSPLRELLYVDDCAAAIHLLADLPDAQFDALLAASRYPVINIGGGTEVSILKLAQKVADIVGYTGEIRTDPAKPDGVPRKLLDNSRMAALGWQAKVSLDEGLRLALADYRARYPAND
ncbi:GDP-L-fucose synthase family protein [Niveibacterium microcysteis]|uniref:GDP-L-fucose synthase n=1 Tax=Niveibacterium microcysteis TaxID=2811415 RepID=A0ABX7M0K7_9RHOO|nr:GDP-L-fucose synthase [Niveibacterium microcysteis]QSI75290.1 GDP-L-fucose synthase [Niveibacterium microcysteis]